jgi:hypothetical protein
LWGSTSTHPTRCSGRDIPSRCSSLQIY